MRTIPEITPESPLGKALTELARHARVAVEIGTGCGLGSTKCICAGLPEGAVLHTHEGCFDQLKVAKSNINTYDHDGSVNVVYGILHRGILPYWHPENLIQHRECWELEIKLVNEAPVVEVPKGKIDLLFLDGGEYTSLGDFLLLWQRATVVVIDDCHPMKSVKNWLSHKLLARASWTLERDEPSDRNGWAIFRRPA